MSAGHIEEEADEEQGSKRVMKQGLFICLFCSSPLLASCVFCPILMVECLFFDCMFFSKSIFFVTFLFVCCMSWVCFF